MSRAAFYIDGFNLYHAIDDLARPRLKWLDLRALGRRVLSDRGVKSKIARIVYCTAVGDDTYKAARHNLYIDALRHSGVEVLQGHVSRERVKWRAACGQTWMRATEKRSDVHLALSLFHDACTTDISDFYLLTTDGDQAATAEFLQRHAPGKRLISVVPPGRDINRAIGALAHGRHRLNAEMLESCLLPLALVDGARGVVARAPRQYHPPPGWVAPRDRPRRK